MAKQANQDAGSSDRATDAHKLVCVHGHFYQPPRENPWLGSVDRQPSAAPAHDWNERVAAECYGPNAAARIVGGDGRIIDIRNNYEKISFNFGPTLLAWMEERRPEMYEEILAADARSQFARGGHGNALAQVYNHLIMPLATRRDRETQVVWGMEDFRHRFCRDPEGMWLAECAVDTETLEALAASGIRFTILAPRQARAWRDLDSREGWRSTDNGGIDPSRPYLCNLPSGRSITIFFYDGPISQAVAFEGLLANGEAFANRLLSGFDGARHWRQLMHIATDGESYGHHHRYGEMALAYALHVIESGGKARLTNYGEYLSLVEPLSEVRIWENSSWSCVHGIERWRTNCGCHSGTRPGWHQKWRAPLREAYDIAKHAADALFEREGTGLLRDPWAARNDYVSVVLGRKSGTEFAAEALASPPTPENTTRALRLLEIQRNSMLMYTSCAWFFDDVGGIETIQTMRYAARLMQLARPWLPDLEERFAEALEHAPSNAPEMRDGLRIWQDMVAPQIVDLERVLANYALLNFDRFYEGTRPHHGFDVTEADGKLSAYGECRIKLSRLSATASLTGERIDAVVCVLHLGGHDFQCRIGEAMDAADYERLHRELLLTFSRRSLAEVVRAIDRNFASRDHALPDLFPECRDELLARVARGAVQRFDSTLAMMFDENRRLMEHLRESGAPMPPGFLAVAEHVLRSRLKRELAAGHGESEAGRALAIAAEARHLAVRADDGETREMLADALSRTFRLLAQRPTERLCRVAGWLLDVMELLGMQLDLWEAQNICFALVTCRPLPAYLETKEGGTRSAPPEDVPGLVQLARRLRIADDPWNNMCVIARPRLHAEDSQAAVPKF